MLEPGALANNRNGRHIVVDVSGYLAPTAGKSDARGGAQAFIIAFYAENVWFSNERSTFSRASSV